MLLLQSLQGKASSSALQPGSSASPVHPLPKGPGNALWALPRALPWAACLLGEAGTSALAVLLCPQHPSPAPSRSPQDDSETHRGDAGGALRGRVRMSQGRLLPALPLRTSPTAGTAPAHTRGSQLGSIRCPRSPSPEPGAPSGGTEPAAPTGGLR